jgi:predicted CXXCH cytochrome family protein
MMRFNNKKAAVAGFLLLIFFLAGCATWEFTAIKDLPVQASVPAPKSCGECHEEQYAIWKNSVHGDSARTAKVGVPGLTGCGACHGSLAAHADDPNNVQPPSILKMNRLEQNRVCGKCHYNRDLMGSGAINPHNRHGLLFSYGFEGFKDTISCLECHGGHSRKTGMLQSIRAHTCFKCHKEAIATMGVFQPLNYAVAGKLCVTCHPAHGATAPHQAVRLAGGALAVCLVCHPTGNPSRLWFQKQNGRDGNNQSGD